MARRLFYSFHYKPDNWRAAQVRNMGVVEGNAPASDNEWEKITKGGAAAIRRWIDRQLFGKSCTAILIGANTAGRKWINYEIQKSWDDGKGLFGIYIHNLKNRAGEKSAKGDNPFENFTVDDGEDMADVVQAYDPPYTKSNDVYAYIKENMEDWIEEALAIREDNDEEE